jgi:predicted O-methyltransferase YrrM
MSSLDEYIEQHTTPEPELFAQITRDTNLHILNPHMLSGQVQGELLRMLSRMIRPQRILELGTFTGYSALCLAEGLAEGGELITIEHNDELEATIRRNLSQSPLGKQIQLIIGDAKQIISDLSSVSASSLSAPAVCQAKPVSLLSGEAGLFDLVFIDADKREYCSYYELVFPLVRQGGFILADNTLWDGHIVDPAYDRDKQTVGLRAFNRMVADDPRVSQVILPLRDGLTIIYKR